MIETARNRGNAVGMTGPAGGRRAFVDGGEEEGLRISAVPTQCL
jgi:hypothetical protein